MREEIPALFETYYFEIIFIACLFMIFNRRYNWLPLLKTDDELNAGELQYRKLKELGINVGTVIMALVLALKYIVILGFWNI